MSVYAFANLDQSRLARIKELEGKIGKTLVAVKPVELKPEDLDQDGLEEIQKLEKELGLALVAVKH